MRKDLKLSQLPAHTLAELNALVSDAHIPGLAAAPVAGDDGFVIKYDHDSEGFVLGEAETFDTSADYSVSGSWTFTNADLRTIFIDRSAAVAGWFLWAEGEGSSEYRISGNSRIYRRIEDAETDTLINGDQTLINSQGIPTDGFGISHIYLLENSSENNTGLFVDSLQWKTIDTHLRKSYSMFDFGVLAFEGELGQAYANISLLSDVGSFGSGENVIFVSDVVTVPTVNPVGGGILYIEGGALKFRGSGGTVTTVAPS